MTSPKRFTRKRDRGQETLTSDLSDLHVHVPDVDLYVRELLFFLKHFSLKVDCAERKKRRESTHEILEEGPL